MGVVAATLVHVTTTDMSLDWLLGPQLEAFVGQGFEVLGASAPGDHVPAIEARGVRHLPLHHATRSMAPHRDMAAFAELWRLFRRFRPDIVHTHNPKPGFYGRLAAAAASVPVVVNTVHGLYAQPADAVGRRAVVYGMEWAASRVSDAELVQNEEDVRVLQAIGVPAEHLFHLGNGIDLERFDPVAVPGDVRSAVREEIGAGPQTPVIGAVGRLVAEKGYAELFDAFESVRRTHPGALLMVVGPEDPAKADGLSSDLLATAARNGVRFLGHRTDMAALYAAMDLYVIASHREGFPRSAMEAAAMGVAVVATDIRGCRQVVDDGVTGRLVPVRDACRLAGALDDLVADRESRARMGEQARAKALVEFDQERVIDLTLDLYSRLLERKAGRRG